MASEFHAPTDPGQPAIYQIRVRGHLDSRWTNWFGGLAITVEDGGETLLTGPVVDQAALHGLLGKVRDLGMALLSVNRVSADLVEASTDQEPPAAPTLLDLEGDN